MKQTLRSVGLLVLLFAGPRAAFATGARYLIITHDDFFGAIQPLAEWKHKKGMMTGVAKLSETGHTTDSIWNYIKEAYDSWQPRPEYVLLAGDITRIPLGQSWPCESDNPYAVNGPQPAGSYSVHWDGRDPRGRMLPTGVYFYRLQVGSVSELKRAILIR